MVAAALHPDDYAAGGNGFVPPDPNALTGVRSRISYKLGREIGAGGNGIVYAISRRPELVAKIAKHELDQHDIDKLNILTNSATADLLEVAAWPTDLIRDASHQIVGFAMPRIIDARPLHELYSPRARVQHFPSADFRFLVHVATNVARLFGAVHKAGFICGDVNHSNVLVRPSGTVAAVDCDSFQVGDGSRFPCLVGTNLFVPPELMGMEFGSSPRTENHDNFGLAVLIFHLLFMGRHPFAGRNLGRGDMGIEQAIEECRYAYSRDHKRTQMQPPPLTPPVASIGPDVADLFERAFHPDNRTSGRPQPSDWITALEDLKVSLLLCQAKPWHFHSPRLSRCPWCEIEDTTRIKLFGGLLQAPAGAGADVSMLWARYQALIRPDAPERLQAEPPDPVLERLRRAKVPTRTPVWQRIRGEVIPYALLFAAWSYLSGASGAIDWLASTYGPILWFVSAVGLEPLARLDAALGRVPLAVLLVGALSLSGPWLSAIAHGAMRSLKYLVVQPDPAAGVIGKHRARLRHEARRVARKHAKARRRRVASDVSDLKPLIEDLKSTIDNLARERADRLRDLAAPMPEAEQLAQFLGGYRVEDADLAGIGPARCIVLRSWGIDTAADVQPENILAIPGFGVLMTDRLVTWRDRVSAGFVANDAPVVDPLQAQRVERSIAAQRARLVKRLRDQIGEVERRVIGLS